MDDLIYRNALIEELKKIRFPCMLPSGAEYLEGVQTAVTRISGVINDAPAVDRWIPCSERLPEENKVVLVSTTTGYVDFAVVRWGKWFPDGYNGVEFPPNRITAWMPKPDAYEPPDTDKGERIIS